MQLVNWQGPLFGPGSEWFWSMLQFVIVAGSLLGLYRQLRIQSAQGAIEQLSSFDRTWTSERFARYKLEALVSLRDQKDPAAIPDHAASAITNFLETLGALARRGNLDATLLFDTYGTEVQLWWMTTRSWVSARRALLRDPAICEHFESLAARMAALDRGAGSQPIDESWVTRNLPSRIKSLENTIRVEQELRSVVWAPPKAAPTRRS